MHITAKPTSFQCNIRCDYCFYLEKKSQFTHTSWMDDETLEVFIRNYISASSHDVYFTWQGGEPTLAGLDFFRRAVQLQKRHGKDKKIFNALQTNGLLLNEEWCDFFREHNFLIGISIDGPRDLHNTYRKNRAGRGTFDKVMSAIELLKGYKIPFNTLTVVNNINVNYPLEVYEFLKSIGSNHIQFIELLETTKPNIKFCDVPINFNVINFSVPSDQYGHFMAKIFKTWVTQDVGTIFIRQFESFISRVLGNGHTSCVFQSKCQDNFIIESNGDIYECDHFVYPDYKIGNINQNSLNNLHSEKLSKEKGVLARECRECDYLSICNGGCPKHRIKLGDGAGVSYFCNGYKILFSTMVPYLNAMVELEKNKIPLVHIMDDRIANALNVNF
ncbi:anaerobic sulfatase maturase [Iodobacter ciconiae]|uniref:Anaerobic sulfatase maturase n=1 Tax=Iodobacter ciconiae TaxID=2496266 RepID=A0A3S8ZQE4_9NEIS|nr:anaerobic sulfatase maturase [Iodobacter ciconiae]AZN35689.1 anaerobic sulfatase maturase [Iodobacter ciconiae]